MSIKPAEGLITDPSVNHFPTRSKETSPVITSGIQPMCEATKQPPRTGPSFVLTTHVNPAQAGILQRASVGPDPRYSFPDETDILVPELWQSGNSIEVSPRVKIRRRHVISQLT